MKTDELIANYSPVGDIISMLICTILLLVITKVVFLSNDRKFKCLKNSLHFVLVASGFNVIFFFAIKNFNCAPGILYALRNIYHFSLLCALYSFIVYMKITLSVTGKTATTVAYITRALFVVCLILDILAPITKFGLCRVDGAWQDSLINPYNIFYVFTLIILAAMLLLYSQRLIRPVRICLINTEILIVMVMIGQGILDTNTFNGITYVLPILVVLIMLHSKPFDDKTGSLGKDSFDIFIQQSRKKNVSVDYLVLKLYISIAEQIPDELGKILNSFWHTSFKDASLFSLSPDLYVLAIPRENRNGDAREKINALINQFFYNYYNQYKLTYKILQLYDISFIDGVSDFLGISKYLLQITEDNSICVTDDKIIEQLEKYKVIRDQLADIDAKQDLNDERVLVYCQPIRNMKTGKYDTAEALMRLSLPQIGIVMPGLFIDIAEQYHYIHTLSKIMLNKVCKLITKLLSEGYDIKRISVNFVASEIISDGFCDEVFDIIKRNNVDTSKIGIELTESQTERDFQIVKRKINILRDAGITLYLDDVGTGYSNLDRIVQYDVDVVKFDRFFLLEAENSTKVVRMLAHLSQAFRDLDYELLYEGVETKEHEKLCLDCGADYIQGFKYSKPLPANELFSFLKNATANEQFTSTAGTELRPVLERKDFTYSEIMEQYGILVTMSKLFYSMHYIDLINNTAKPYNPTEDIRVVNVVNSSEGADEMMRQIMRMCTEYKYVDEVLKFTELTTLADRMRGKKILQSDKYIGKSIGWYVSTFYTIEADEDGRPTKVLYTTRSVEEHDK